MKGTEQKVIKFITANRLIEKGDKILVALSGGPDSVFMLHFLNKYKKKFGIKIGTFHVNHKLRGKESDADEEFCKKICKVWKNNFGSARVNVRSLSKTKKISIEEAARELRYDRLTEYASKNYFNKIATAHNLDDNAETILLNLFTGTGLTGLTGIPVKRENIIRPVLCLSKNEILQYLTKNKIEYRIDSSNLADDYKRNFIRHNISPLIKSKINKSYETALLRNGKIIEENLKLFDSMLKRLKEKYIVVGRESVSIDLKILDEVNREALGQILKHLFTDRLKIEFSYNIYEVILSILDKQTGRKINLSKGYSAIRERDKIVIYKLENMSSVSTNVKVGQTVNFNGEKISLERVKTFRGKFTSNGKTEFISGDSLNDIFILRKWKPGDKFIPLGMKGFKKVSDFLNEQKTASKEKRDKMVLTNRNNIVWVVGLRIDDRFKINDNTKRVIKLCTT